MRSTKIHQLMQPIAIEPTGPAGRAIARGLQSARTAKEKLTPDSFTEKHGDTPSAKSDEGELMT